MDVDFKFFNVFKTIRPPEGSYLATLYEKYAVEFPGDQQYSWDDLRSVVEVQKQHWHLWDKIEVLQEQLRVSR